MSILLALLLCLQETPERLIEELGAETIEERERAIKTLTDWGDKARPALEKATQHADKEIAGRAREVLAAIASRKAQAEYKKIEAALLAAKTLRIRYRTERLETGDATPPHETGTILFETGNRILYLSKNEAGPRCVFVSDGHHLFWNYRRPSHGNTGSCDLIPDLARRLRQTLLTDGPDLLPLLTLADGPKQVENALTPTDLSMQTSGVDGQSGTLSYRTVIESKEVLGTYWYDPRSFAPLRQETRWKENDRQQVHRATYEEFSSSAEVRDDAFDLESWKAGFKATVAKLDGMASVKDGGELETQETSYRSVLEYLTRAAPERLLQEAWSPGYAVFSERPGELRGNAIRLQVLFLQSNPIRLEKKIGEVEWVHRTYLCDLTGKEGYVVDLLEAPRDLKKKTPVLLDAVFLKVGEYEGQKGPLRAPFLLGQRLAVVPEK